MQNPCGQIVSIREGHARRRAVVAVEAADACARCASGKGCGAGIFGKQTGRRHLEAKVADDQDLGVGDLVRIALESKNVLRAAIVIYGYPLSGVVLAAIGAHATGLGDVGAASGVLCGVAAGMLAARLRLQNSRCLLDFTPIVVERLSAVSG